MRSAAAEPGGACVAARGRWLRAEPPLSTPIDEIFRYTLTADDGDLLALRTLQDWSFRMSRAHARTPGRAAPVSWAPRTTQAPRASVASISANTRG